jgi:hypothetical protein
MHALVATVALLLHTLLSLPAYHLDRETPDERLERASTTADAIASATLEATCTGPFTGADFCVPVWDGERLELAALLVAIGWHESTFAKHVGAGACKPWECDGGRARHYWQTQAGPRLPRAEWLELEGVEYYPATRAAYAAARELGFGYRRCKSIEGAVAFYARPKTGCRWPGAAARAATYRRVLGQLAGSAGAAGNHASLAQVTKLDPQDKKRMTARETAHAPTRIAVEIARATEHAATRDLAARHIDGVRH